MRRNLRIILLSIGLLFALVAAAWKQIDYYMLTGSFFPIEKIETLTNPVQVTGWTTNGLQLTNGQTAKIPGMTELPVESAALTEATKRGVQIDADGRMWALVQIHHWCGNDPVRNHIAKVDLSEFLTFLQEGKPEHAIPAPELLPTTSGSKFSEFGWQVGEWYQFDAWRRYKDSL